MMEPDDIKELLRSRLEQESVTIPYQELALALSKKTSSITSKIRKTIYSELALSAGFLAGAILAAVYFQMALVYWFSGATLIFCLGFGFYLLKLNKNLNKFEKSAGPVKKNLQDLIAILQRFIRLYFIATLSFLPIIFLFGLFVGYIDVHNRHLQQHFSWNRGLGFFTALYAGWSVLIIVFSRWYINRLYGRHLQHLKEMAQEIEKG